MITPVSPVWSTGATEWNAD